MTGSAAEALSLLALVFTLAGAVARPRGLPELVFAAPAAAAILIAGAESVSHAGHAVRQLLSTVAFLALILMFSRLCADAGVFDYLGALTARACRGQPILLLGLVVACAALVTTALTLDATVVLLTPVVLRTAARVGTPARPHSYACVQLANAGSLFLPVSNLTNLLAVSVTGVSFGAFARSMALPWVVAAVVEFALLALYFRTDLVHVSEPSDSAPTPLPRYAMTVVIVTLAGFVLASSFDVAPAWAALGGVVLLAVRSWTPAKTPELIRAASLEFCLFVLALGVIVDAVARHGLSSTLRDLLPHGASLPALLGVAFLAAATANVLNNIPATLLLAPLVAAQPSALFAMLLGVNIGPNATYMGSLATLLWRRQLPPADKPKAAQFHRFGLITTPVVLVACTVALWAVS